MNVSHSSNEILLKMKKEHSKIKKIKKRIKTQDFFDFITSNSEGEIHSKDSTLSRTTITPEFS